MTSGDLQDANLPRPQADGHGIIRDRTPRIAVVLPVYNGERYLAEAIQSVLKQTFTDFELVVIDDGSTDGTAEILEGFRDPRLRVIRFPQNRGLVTALNTGVRESRSDLIARMDADDICVPQRFERQVAFLDAHPEVAVCGTWAQEFGGQRSLHRLPIRPEQIRARLFFGWAMNHPTLLMRRAFLEAHGLTYRDEFAHVEDFDFVVRAAELAPLANIPEVLLLYRVHERQTSFLLRDTQVQMESGVFLRQLRMLMPDATAEERVFHMQFAIGELDGSRLREAEQWLARLDEANRRSARYDEASFELAIRWKWYRLALRACPTHPGALLAYWKSPWASFEMFREQTRPLLTNFSAQLRFAGIVLRRPLRLAKRVWEEALLAGERVAQGVRMETIDPEAFTAAIPDSLRSDVASSILELLKPTDNVSFFADAGRYVGRLRALPPGIPVLPDLFPPNIAVLDFLSKYARNPAQETVLDYGCGIGALLVYLRKLGFAAYGYDNWSQIAKSTAEAFLSEHGAPHWLLGADDLDLHDFTILSCVGIHWSWLTETQRVLRQPSLRYVLIDKPYRPKSIAGFHKIAEYKNLLTIYERSV